MSEAIVDVSLTYSDDSENSKGFVYGECIGEIVRCKDCKHHKHEDNGMVWCPNIVGSWVKEDWFCADGEGKDDATD